jgi:hypothetical protein
MNDALMEKIAIEKSHEKENASSWKNKEVLDFGEKLFVYFMESYGRVNTIEKEYDKVQYRLSVLFIAMPMHSCPNTLICASAVLIESLSKRTKSDDDNVVDNFCLSCALSCAF